MPHIPERCWAVGGLELTRNSEGTPLAADRGKWRAKNPDGSSPYFVVDVVDPVTADLEAVTMPLGDLVATTIEFQDPKDPQLRQVGGYFFIANGRIESTSYGVRQAAFNLTDRYAYYCKIQLTKSGKVSTEDGSLLEPFCLDAADLLTGLLPEVMKCLPDWPTWENVGRGEAAPAVSAEKSAVFNVMPRPIMGDSDQAISAAAACTPPEITFAFTTLPTPLATQSSTQASRARRISQGT